MINFPYNYQILLFYSFVKPLLDFYHYNFSTLHVIENFKNIISKLSYLELLQIHMDLNSYPNQHWKNFHASLLIFMVNNSFLKLLPLINTSLWKCFFSTNHYHLIYTERTIGYIEERVFGNFQNFREPRFKMSEPGFWVFSCRVRE